MTSSGNSIHPFGRYASSLHGATVAAGCQTSSSDSCPPDIGLSVVCFLIKCHFFYISSFRILPFFVMLSSDLSPSPLPLNNIEMDAIVVSTHNYSDITASSRNCCTLGGKRTTGRSRKMWLDNMEDWTWLSVDDLLHSTQDTTH